LLFPQDNRIFGISVINLCHLGAELSILRCRKCFRGVNYPFFFFLIWGHFFANLGTSCIPYTVLRCEKHVTKRPDDACVALYVGGFADVKTDLAWFTQGPLVNSLQDFPCSLVDWNHVTAAAPSTSSSTPQHVSMYHKSPWAARNGGGQHKEHGL
jgi:hypothetical protein